MCVCVCVCVVCVCVLCVLCVCVVCVLCVCSYYAKKLSDISHRLLEQVVTGTVVSHFLVLDEVRDLKIVGDIPTG